MFFFQREKQRGERVRPNVASTMIFMRPIEEKNNEPTGQFIIRQPTKVEYNVEQVRPCRSMRLIKARATAIAILAFSKSQCD